MSVEQIDIKTYASCAFHFNTVSCFLIARIATNKRTAMFSLNNCHEYFIAKWQEKEGERESLTSLAVK